MMDDAMLAVRLARTAGEILMAIRSAADLTGKAAGVAGDCTANAYLVSALESLRPDDGLLSEESADDPRRLDQRRVWIVDPLDGTREFAEGRDDWAVHVALAVDGVAMVGAVAQPGLGVVYGSAEAKPLPPAGEPRIVVSRSRAPAIAGQVAERIGATLLPMGSAGAKAMAVLRGEAVAYVHAGGQYEWDSAAPVAVAQTAGLVATRLDGSPLRYNCASPYLPDLLICRSDWVAPLRAALDSL